MKWGIFAVLIVAAGSIIGWQFSSPASNSVSQSPEFVLEAKAVSDQGPSTFLGPETVYTYSRKLGAKKKELWRITLPEKHVAHWIGDNGHVWVLGEISGRQLPRRRLWIRNPNANELATINQSMSDDGIKEARLVKVSYQATRLTLPAQAKGVRHITEYWAPEQPIRYFMTTADCPEVLTPIDRYLKGNEPIRTIHPVPDAPQWELWTRSPFNPGVVTIAERNIGNYPSNVSVISSQFEVERSPAHIDRSPNGMILWFFFGFNGQPKEASMTVYDYNGRKVDTVDFLKEGKFETPYAAEHSLRFKEMQALENNRWVPLASARRVSIIEPSTIRISDDRKRNFDIFIPAPEKKSERIGVKRSAQDAALTTKEAVYPDHVQAGDREFKSENGSFTLRVRKLASKSKDPVWVKTLIFQPENGKAHQFWSKSTPFEVTSGFVSNGGRSYTLESGFGPKGTPIEGKPQAWLSIQPFDGQNPMNVDLAGQNMFRSFEAAVALDLTKWSMKYAEPITQEEFEGESVRIWTGETVVLALPDGTKRELNVVEAGQNMGFDRVYWRHLK